jgi:hypothetical protein
MLELLCSARCGDSPTKYVGGTAGGDRPRAWWNEKPAPQIFQFVYEVYLLRRAGYCLGKYNFDDVDWGNINGVKQAPYAMVIECADGTALTIQGAARRSYSATDHRHSAWYQEFYVQGYHEPPDPVGLCHEQIDLLIQQRGGPDLDQMESLEMKAFILNEAKRARDLVGFGFEGCTLDQRGNAVSIGAFKSDASDPSARPKRYKNLTNATAIKLLADYGVWLQFRKTDRYGLSLGVRGDAAKLPEWLLDYVREHRIELANECRKDGWLIFSPYIQQWGLVRPARFDRHYKVGMILASWNRRDGLGDQFKALWRLYLEYQRWYESLNHGPFDLWWYAEDATSFKLQMERALLEHPTDDVATIRAQLKLLRSKGETGGPSKHVMDRVSKVLLKALAHTPDSPLAQAA